MNLESFYEHYNKEFNHLLSYTTSSDMVWCSFFFLFFFKNAILSFYPKNETQNVGEGG